MRQIVSQRTASTHKFTFLFVLLFFIVEGCKSTDTTPTAPSTHSAPTITSFNPSSGLVGTAVTITGTNFGPTLGTSTVAFGTTAATATSWSNTSLIVTVPTLSAGSYTILVTTASGAANSATQFTVTPPSTYPSVAGNWKGNLHNLFSGTTVRDWALEVNFTQTANSLAGSWLYTLTTATSYQGIQTRDYFIGTIMVARQITITDTSWKPLNWSGDNWGLNSYNAVLSTGGDSISGVQTSLNEGDTGTFVLVKQ